MWRWRKLWSITSARVWPLRHEGAAILVREAPALASASGALGVPRSSWIVAHSVPRPRRVVLAFRPRFCASAIHPRRLFRSASWFPRGLPRRFDGARPRGRDSGGPLQQPACGRGRPHTPPSPANRPRRAHDRVFSPRRMGGAELPGWWGLWRAAYQPNSPNSIFVGFSTARTSGGKAAGQPRARARRENRRPPCRAGLGSIGRALDGKGGPHIS
mmetsp:Transcript_9865/g.33462  ORF Transcript_9865/g.33462 Transcript_9865/m.33462 type:complete len:215 (-) Transcript_9865:196-840(-)